MVVGIEGELGRGVDVVEDGPEFGGGLEGAEFFEVVVPGGTWRGGARVVVPEGPFVME